jgi:MoxR-like ATPase
VGSGKTSLALAVAKAAAAGGRSAGAALVTAGAGWSTAEAAGHVVRAAERERWLIVDEIDRADLDTALGALSGFLDGLAVELPDDQGEARAPDAWRLIATAETEAAASGALTRRFAHIQLPNQSDEGVAGAVDAATRGDATAAAAVKKLLALRDIRPLGAGPFVDAARHAAERNAITPASESELARETYAAYLAPHLRGLDPQRSARLAELVEAL